MKGRGSIWLNRSVRSIGIADFLRREWRGRRGPILRRKIGHHIHRFRKSFWMWCKEELFRSLSEFGDLCCHRFQFQRICYVFQLHGPFICQMVIKIVGFQCFFTFLFVTKNQINPSVEMMADIIGFKSLSTFTNEIGCAGCPWWKHHITQFTIVSSSHTHIQSI